MTPSLQYETTRATMSRGVSIWIIFTIHQHADFISAIQAIANCHSTLWKFRNNKFSTPCNLHASFHNREFVMRCLLPSAPKLFWFNWRIMIALTLACSISVTKLKGSVWKEMSKFLKATAIRSENKKWMGAICNVQLTVSLLHCVWRMTWSRRCIWAKLSRDQKMITQLFNEPHNQPVPRQLTSDSSVHCDSIISEIK